MQVPSIITRVLVALMLGGCAADASHTIGGQELMQPGATIEDVRVVLEEPSPEPPAPTHGLTHIIHCEEIRAMNAIEKVFTRHGSFRGWVLARIVSHSAEGTTGKRGMGKCVVSILDKPIDVGPAVHRMGTNLLVPPQPDVSNVSRRPTHSGTWRDDVNAYRG